jgi:hypothetical protein
MEPMKIGSATEVRIKACEFWNKTGVLVRSGGRYSLRVRGSQYWWDMVVRTTANGYSSLILRCAESRRRFPAADWLTLIGALDGLESTAFRIGTGADWQPSKDGELTCYANDLTGMYWNNWGSVRLAIERLA